MNTTEHTTRTAWIEDAAEAFVALIPSHIDRLSWGPDRLRAHQNEALRTLVRTAAQWSPFHRPRLAGIDLESMTIDRLAEVPVMTKREMAESPDEVFTDPRLTRAVVDRHLAGLGEEPELLFDEYLVLTTGGSSGTRGVFVVPRDQVPHFAARVLRAGMARLAQSMGWPPPSKLPAAIVAAPGPMHATRSVSRVLESVATLTYAPVTLPLEEIISRLNRCRPAILVGYASVLARLADASTSGELEIEPNMIVSTSEQLLPDYAQRITAGFGMPPTNSFGTSEGVVGTAPPGSPAFTFAGDETLIEFVDADDRPVPAGTPSHHILVTQLTSYAQPLIRYRIDDVMTELPPDPSHGHQRATVEGRNDEPLSFGAVTIHPIAIRSALLHHREISEYQVRVQRDDTAASLGSVHLDLTTSAAAPLDGFVDTVAGDVAEALQTAGVTAHVTASVVDDLQRDPATGKAPRFVTS